MFTEYAIQQATLKINELEEDIRLKKYEDKRIIACNQLLQHELKNRIESWKRIEASIERI